MRCTTANSVLPVALLAVGLSLCPAAAQAATATFDDLTLAADSYWNGSPTTGLETFGSGGTTFNNYYDDTYGPYWEGWAYSSMTYDPADYVPGAYNPGNGSVPTGVGAQYHAVAGTGAGGSSNYGVGYEGFTGTTPTIVIPTGASLQSVMITNNNFAYYSMLEGDPPGPFAFAKKFGGASGNDEDWFLLTITGKDASNAITGTVELYLADYRFPDNTQDYIVDDWTLTDLSSLGEANSLEFGLTSSDTGGWGMNTPAYFAIDNLVFSTDSTGMVPEPSACVVWAASAAAWALAARRRRQDSRLR